MTVMDHGMGVAVKNPGVWCEKIGDLPTNEFFISRACCLVEDLGQLAVI